MTRHVPLLLFAIGVPVFTADAQASAPSSIVGTWRGTSICRPVGKPACHDEIALYHFRVSDSASARAAESPRVEHLTWLADKVVNGVEEEMGTMECTYDAASGVVTCPMRGWLWKFQPANDRGTSTLTGTLSNPSGVIWRDVRVARASASPR